MKKSSFSYIFDDILDIAHKKNIELTLLEENFVYNLRKEVINIYPSVNLSGAIEFYKGEGLQTDESYILLSNYLDENEIVFFIPESQEKKGIRFKHGNDFPLVLESLNYFIEFFITDNTFSYLIGENHSGILMALGKAEEWLKGLK